MGIDEQRCLSVSTRNAGPGAAPDDERADTPDGPQRSRQPARAPCQISRVRFPNGQVSLEVVLGTVSVPPHTASFWRQWCALVVPFFLARGRAAGRR